MSSKPMPGIARDFRTLFGLGRIGDWTDGQLLECFRSGRGPDAELAFTILVQRHGPMVLRVCRGILADPHDAQDAFQATFLVLLRAGGSIRSQTSVVSWLYGVAHRIASRARVDAARRRALERRAAEQGRDRHGDAPGAPSIDLDVVDEEIRRLPEAYRSVVVLCCLEGLTQEQAASRLGWPSGTVRGRLSRARELLRDRLVRRGIAPPAAAVLASLAPREAAAVPASLVGETTRTAMAALGQGAGAAGVIPPGVAALAEAASTAVRIKLTAAVLGVGLVATAVVGLSARPGPPREPAVPPITASDLIAAKANWREPAPVPARASVASPDPEDAPTPPDRASSAVAVPLRGIEVDGDLGDWPASIERHRVLKQFIGGGYRETADLHPDDLSAAFLVGYDPEEQLVYLAVTVRDDALIVGHGSHLDTDAVEVYIDGLHSDRSLSQSTVKQPFWEHHDLSWIPVYQYVGIPGEGRIYGTPYRTNPILLAGDLNRTRTRMAYRREAGVTTYEWAIQPFDQYPDRPTRLEPGRRIGFDLAVVDKDDSDRTPREPDMPAPDRPAWIYWGPTWTGMKVLDAGNLGELILAGER